MSDANNTIKKTIIVAASLSIVCSVIVSTAATVLKPVQAANKLLDLQSNVLAAAGLLQDDTDITAAFENIDKLVIDLQTGEVAGDIDADTYDQRKAEKDPALSRALDNDEDVASINRLERYALVYLVRGSSGGIDKVILPVRGYGLWSTLRGFLAVESDGMTVAGMTYYEHAETPGLGGEVDNPKWKAVWPGKKLFDAEGNPAIDVIKGKVDPRHPKSMHQIDGLAGATITANGVENTFTFWLGDQGFGPFLERLKQGKVS